ncbi:MAG: cardiolipin synthase [Clostridia bacterium]|nr:cardiolipin synthase [Clostridia bacterium]
MENKQRLEDKIKNGLPRTKKAWRKALVRKRASVILLLLLQIGAILYFVRSTSGVSAILHNALTIVSIFVALYIVGKDGDPTAKLSWVFLILIVPVFGGLFYLFYTFQYGKKNLRRMVGRSEETFGPLFFPDLSVLPMLEEEGHAYLPLMRYLEGHCHFPVYAHSECTYLSPGEAFFTALLIELEKAERYIHIEMFIIEEGLMWDSVLDILKRKAAAGVDVQLIYDDVGCFLTLPRDYCNTLAQYGIKAQVFNPFRPILAFTQNQRDHRKIISIDGKVAFTGGCNLADEYINAIAKHGHWKDTMLCVRGEAAWCLTLISLQIRSGDATTNEINKLCPWQDAPCATPSDGYVQPYADNPLLEERVGENLYLHVIQSARSYVYIESPYLIVDDTMLRAMSMAAKAGVDVRIIVPRIPDHPLVHQTTRSFYEQLLKAGVKVYEYTPGFIHAKLCVSDDKIAVVGSSNLDYRSLYQHFECGVVLYNSAAVADATSDFLTTLELCERMTQKDCARTLAGRLWQEILRLFAPLM